MQTIDHFEEIIQSFQLFLDKLNILCLHVHDDLKNLSIWIDNEKGEFIQDRDKTIYVLKHLSPSLQLLPQETFACPGAIAATTETIKLIKQVNLAKDKFKAAVQNYRKSFKSYSVKPARHILTSAGYGGIKLLQVYRHIPYINYHPRRIAWTKSKKGGHVIINAKQAREKLLKTGQGEHIDIQLSKVSLLKPNDKLVIYRQLKTCWGINIATFKNENNRSNTHRIREESLPLFFIHDNKLPDPIVCFSKKINRENTGTRSDKRLEEKPFLKSIRAYRYKPS